MSDIPPLCDVKTETAWAALAIHGSPRPFLHAGSVRGTRRETQTYIGDAWRHEDETPAQGWKRAYRAGWRAIRVEVAPL
jgi:hypothetical protein